jgi:hypothetical protein
MVEGDPLELRDRAWAEIQRLRAAVNKLEGHIDFIGNQCLSKAPLS